jgi:hypothetical protein
MFCATKKFLAVTLYSSVITTLVFKVIVKGKFHPKTGHEVPEGE